MKSPCIAMSDTAKLRPRIFLLAILSGLIIVGPAQAQNQKWDTSYIAEDTFFMIGINVRHLLAYEKEDSKLRKLVTEAFVQNNGINVEEIDQLQFLVGGTAEAGQEEDMFQIKMIFNKPQEMDELPQRMFHFDGHEPAEYKKMRYLKSSRKHTPSVYAPSDKVLVVANDVRLLKLMESEDSMGEFVERVKQANGNADLFLTFKNTATIKRMIGDIAEEIEGLPFDIQDIASEAKQGSFTINLAANEPLIGSIEATDEEGAERLKRAADALVALGKVGIPVATRQIDESMKREIGGPEFRKTTIQEQMQAAKQGLQLASSALEGTTITSDGNMLECKVVIKGGVVEVVKSLTESIASGRLILGFEDRPIEDRPVEIELPRLKDDDRPKKKRESDIEELDFEDD